MAQETITIKCPLCPEQHTYRLLPTYDPVYGLMTINTNQPHYKEREFTRTFICPTTKEMFEASFSIVESSEYLIKDVGNEYIE
jgi:hypothetical protein